MFSSIAQVNVRKHLIHCSKKMKAEPTRLIPRKLAENLEILMPLQQIRPCFAGDAFDKYTTIHGLTHAFKAPCI